MPRGLETWVQNIVKMRPLLMRSGLSALLNKREVTACSTWACDRLCC